MRILCATDFSECAGVATEVASALARRFGGGVLLVHAFQMPAPGNIGLDGLAAVSYDRDLRQAVEAALERAAKPARASGAGVETRLVEGSPARSIVHIAEEAGAELLVLGSVGHGPVERLMVGSVTDRVARSAHQPVLAVRGPTEGFSAWAKGERPLRVLLGVDASAASDAAVEWVRLLRRQGPVDVTFVHVFWPPVSAGGGGAEGSLISPDPAFAAEVERGFRERIGTLEGDGSVTFRVWPALGSLAYALNHWAAETQADLIAVGHEHRGLLERLWRGSAAISLLHHARVSVLAIPGPELAATEAEGAPAPQPREAAPAGAFGRIMVPLDLSERHLGALDRAALLAEGSKGEVVLLHVVETIPGLEPEEDRSFYQRLEEQARAALGPRRDALEARGLRARLELRYGRRTEEIIRAAADLEIELLVLSSPKVDLENPGSAGSTLSYKVGILAQCPVLLVK